MSITAPGDTTLGVDTVSLNTTDTDLIPVGARFTIAGESGSPVHIVQARTGNPTTSIDFTPAIAAGVADDAVITFDSCQIEIKIGEGDVKWTESREINYELDRGVLDTVRQGDEQPVEVTISATFEHVRTGTSESITPTDAIKGQGGASEWVSSSDDQCEMFAVDLVIEYQPPCGSAELETITFPDFRWENLEFSFKDATIDVSGRCNSVEPSVARS
jgi:hypothetical protein